MRPVVTALLKYGLPLLLDEAKKYLKTEEGQRHARDLRDAFLSAALAPASPTNADGTPVVDGMDPIEQPGPPEGSAP